MTDTNQQSEKLSPAEAMRVTAALGLAKQQAGWIPPGGLQAGGQPVASQAPPGIKMFDMSTVLNVLHARVAVLEAKAKKEELKAATFVSRYWPLAAGIATAVAEHFIKF